MSKKKKMPLGGLTVALLSASVILLAGSTVGSARAALTYYSENYGAQVEVSKIGVSLVENDAVVSERNYTSNGNWKTKNEKLLTVFEDGKTKLVPGKKYDEKLTVENSGSIDTYVRVILKKSWINEEGEKDTALSPKLINLNLLSGSKWMIDESSSTPERTILYYTEPLKPGAKTEPLSDKISIDGSVSTKVEKNVTEDKETGYKTFTTAYVYDGYQFQLEAEADAVQTHNAQDAIKSAWGVDVDVDGNGNISLR
ncbi:hypothetical protein ACTM90_15005 [Oliverpabstia intestinalis]|uniref:hypothetical protein n=1 Tax=Oliverpabstia intestinalis TaxID=2606633 RepID=UPI003F8CDF67